MGEYFSHDYDTREDEKIRKLLYKLKMEGYGIYWSIIEMLYKNDGHMELDYDEISYTLRSSPEQVKSVINDFNLFEINEKKFSSRSVLKRIEIRKAKATKARKAAKKRWDKEK